MPDSIEWLVARLSPGRLAAALGLALLLVAYGSAPVIAQAASVDDSAVDVAPTTDEIDSLIQVIEDPQEREKFLDHLRTLRDVEAERQTGTENNLGSTAIDAASNQMERVGGGILALLQTLSDLPEIGVWLKTQLDDPQAGDLWLEVGLRLAAVIAAAVIAGSIVYGLVARPRRLLAPAGTEHLWVVVPLQFARMLLALLVPAAVFGAVYAALSVLQARETTRLVVLATANAYLIVAVVMALARELLAPHSAFRRITNLSDENAAYSTIWTRRLAVVGVYGYFAAQVTLLLGLPSGAYQVLLRLVGLALTGLAIVLILQVRQDVAGAIRGNDSQPGALRTRLAAIWHILAIVYVIAFFVVWMLSIEDGFIFLLRATVLTVLLVAAVQLLFLGLSRLAGGGFSLSAETRAKFPGLEARANRFLPVLRRFLKVAVFLAAIVIVLEVWGFGTLTWLASDAGAGLVNAVAMIVLVALLGLIVSEIFNVTVERYLQRLDDRRVSATRARTLLPLLRTAFRVVLIVLMALVILSEIGLDIAPLLAGAGVIGLAIGFGAQKLVQDVITGFFILVEDSVSVGDFVNAGGHSGTVESMSIRSIQMRDLDGVVHTVPFSSVDTVMNYSKDFAYAVLDIGIAYRENTDEVTEIIRSVGQEMRADSPVKADIIDDMEIFGVNELGDSAVVVRARFKTRPLMQWGVRREFYRRIKLAFDEKGIEIPFPHQTIYFGEDKSGNAPPAHVRIAGGGTADPPAPVQAPPADKTVPESGSADRATPVPGD